MANFNSVTLVGRLTDDPVLKYSNSGTAVGSIRLAINEIWTDRGGNKRKTTTFVSVVMWDKLAETVKEYQKKGSEVLVFGKLRTNSWQDENGNNRSRMEILARDIQFLGKRVVSSTKEPDPSENEIPI